MKILLPTDFSQLSKIAIRYAIGLSKDFELDIILLHVANTITPTMARLGSRKLGEAIKNSAGLSMKELFEAIKKENGPELKISSKIIYNASVTKGVEDFSTKNDIDIVCMGTKGATGLKKNVFGSNAAGVIANSSIPVLTIPEFARYTGVNHMVYSCDRSNLENELNVLIPYAKRMNACVHILHMNKESDTSNEDLERQVKQLSLSVPFENTRVKVLQSNSVIKGLNQYVADVDADMVAMFTRKTSLFEKLFDKSVTQETAFQAKTPLLTFQKK